MVQSSENAVTNLSGYTGRQYVRKSISQRTRRRENAPENDDINRRALEREARISDGKVTFRRSPSTTFVEPSGRAITKYIWESRVCCSMADHVA